MKYFVIMLILILNAYSHFLFAEKKEEEYPKRENILRLYPRFQAKDRDENERKEIEKKLSQYFEEKQNL